MEHRYVKLKLMQPRMGKHNC